jgi:hypothetical protein
MRNAKNPTRRCLHQAYLHVDHLSYEDRLALYPRRVVEQRVLVEVRGSNCQPGVVDDHDLGVNVQRAREPAAEGRDRRSQKALGAVICGCQDAELSAGRVGAVCWALREGARRVEVVVRGLRSSLARMLTTSVAHNMAAELGRPRRGSPPFCQTSRETVLSLELLPS